MSVDRWLDCKRKVEIQTHNNKKKSLLEVKGWCSIYKSVISGSCSRTKKKGSDRLYRELNRTEKGVTVAKKF